MPDVHHICQENGAEMVSSCDNVSFDKFIGILPKTLLGMERMEV